MRAANTFRRLVRRTVPLELRQKIAQARRAGRDRAAGITFRRDRGGAEWPVAITLSQPVIPSALLEAKLANLRRGAALLDSALIAPGEIWSFWNRVGRPTARNGFARGRNIVDGRLVRQTGGGLCQLSSLLYHLALLGGLEITERHPHSIDIYREEERFTPLGADATVVWGFKDLRLRNPHPFAVSIGCFMEGDRLVGVIRCNGTIAPRNVSFLREPIAPGRVLVRTVVDGSLLCDTEYEQKQGLPLA